jgi:hypothetical protein
VTGSPTAMGATLWSCIRTQGLSGDDRSRDSALVVGCGDTLAALAKILSGFNTPAEDSQYRLVGPPPAEYANAQPVQPSLEDGNVWLMQSLGQASQALTWVNWV